MPPVVMIKLRELYRLDRGYPTIVQAVSSDPAPYLLEEKGKTHVVFRQSGQRPGKIGDLQRLEAGYIQADAVCHLSTGPWAGPSSHLTPVAQVLCLQLAS